jgi:hypothetical protein
LRGVNVAETLLVYLGAPLVIILVMAALIFLPGGAHRRSRYRPGQPWEHEPIWYEPHPEHTPAADGHGAERPALPAGAGTSTAVAPAPARPAGPLGGARGTW